MMSGDPVAFGSILELCQHQHRRIFLGTLAAEQRSLTLDDLMKLNQTPLTGASKDGLREVRTELYHVHLPMLATAGPIDYDSERHLVEPTEQLKQIQSILSTIIAADPSLESPMTL